MVTGTKSAGDPIAVLLVGGTGTRLGLGPIPKPMVPIAGTPLLELTIRNLAAQGLRRFLLLAHHSAEHIRDHFGDGSGLGVEIDVIAEKTPRGTFGAIYDIRERLTEPFLVFYGDVLFDVDVDRFVRWSSQKGGLGAIFVHPNDHPFDSDLVAVDGSDRISRFIAKPHEPSASRNLVSAAIYRLSPAILDQVSSAQTGQLDWGRDVFPALVAAGGELYAYRSTEYVKDIGTPERRAKAERHYLSGVVASRSYRHKQRAIFLDRDGILNREVDGVFKPDMLEILPDAGASVKRINQSPYLAICVTNQPALAKGFMSFEDLQAVHIALDAQLAEQGAFLDDLFYCPHHPESGHEGEVAALKIPCSCRKPEPGLLLQAAERHNIDLSASYLIGDHIRDVHAAIAVNCQPYLVGPEPPAADLGPIGHHVESLAAAIDHIEKTGFNQQSEDG